MFWSNAMKPMFNTLRFFERAAAFLQGKGYGTATIQREVSAVGSKLSGAPSLAIDVGGNIGSYTKELTRVFKNIEVHVFEPSATNIEKLKQSFQGESSVMINPLALSESSGTATLFSNEPGGGLASLANRRLDHFGLELNCTEKVQTIKFEDYWINVLKERAIDIAKLDIEGFELAALKGFGRALKNTKVVQFEFGGCNIDTRTSFQDFFYFFKDAGFDIFRITPFGLQAVDRYREVDEFYSTTNFIAVNHNMIL